MPLYEFLRMARGKLESAQQKATCSTDLSSVRDNDFVELVWENGQVMVQGQSNSAKKSPIFNDVPSQMPGIRDKFIRNFSNPKVAKLGMAKSDLDDGCPSVSSGEISFSQDDETVSWLDYSVDDRLRQDYFSELLPEISGVTGNDTSTRNSFASIDERNCSHMVGHSHNAPIHNDVNIELWSASKVCTSSAGSLSLYSPHQGQISVPSLGLGVSNIVNSTNHNPDVFLGDSVQNHASGDGSMMMKMQKQNVGSSGSGSCLLNLSHFSRPAALFRANLQKTDVLATSCSSVVEKMGKEENVPAAGSNIPIKSTSIEPSDSSRKEIDFHDQPNLVSAKVDSRTSMVKPLEESCPTEPDALCLKDSVKNDKSPGRVIGASTTKGVGDAEKTVEPVVASSSVCSGNSAERASNDQTHNSKRKYRDNEESESRSEDIEEEYVRIKKPAPAQGGSGSKRSRAAEVHNLSERRRRDRINEKMRVLQELIPNCNKADKASMLDEAIEYLKTLQLQVQIMSMGAGLCMPRMMFPTGLQHMHAAHLPHFSPVGGRMGFGMGMFDMNSGSPRFPIFPIPPMQGAYFPSPPIPVSSTFQGITGSNLPVFGHPGQGLPMSVPRAPLVPLLGQAPISSTVGLNDPRMRIPVEAPRASPVFNTDVLVQNKNLQLIHNANAGSSMNQISAQLQATNDALDQSASMPKDDPVPDACVTANVNLTNTNDVISSKEGSD